MKNLFKKIVNIVWGKHFTNSFPSYIIFLLDLLLVVISCIILVFFEYYGRISIIKLKSVSLFYKFLPVIIIFAVSFLMSGSYQGILRYSGFNDIERIGISTMISLVSLIMLFFVFDKIHVRIPFPSYVESIEVCFLSFFLLSFIRLVIKRIYNEYFRAHPHIINTIIYGAGDAGPITQSVLYQDTSCQYVIKAFIDDSKQKIGKSINGVPVIKPNIVLNKKYIDDHKIDTMILAIPSLSDEDKNELINKGLDLGLTVKNVPHANSWINGKLTVNQIENIKIEDLLGRESITLDKENVTKDLKGKIVMVTGAAGSIGSEICRQVIRYQPKLLILLDQAESPMYDIQFELNNNKKFSNCNVPREFIVANIKDHDRMEYIFKKYRPQIIFHAAAYKHVPLMEQFPYEAVLVNVFGTKNIADLAIKYEAKKFVMISTDKAVNPTNVMGTTKRIAEIYTQSRKEPKTQFITTRFGNVLGSNGSVIPLFKKQLAHGGPLTVTDRNITRFFMTIPEACSLVLEASAIGSDGSIFVFDMGQPVKIYDLAKRMITLSKMQNVEIEITGLRPGEKLYEEVLASKENTIPTDNSKIMIAKVRPYEKTDVDKKIEQLRSSLNTYDDFAIVGKMKEIVPEFKSNNSKFEILDTITNS